MHAGASCSCQAPWHVDFGCGCSFAPGCDPIRSMVIGLRPRLRGLFGIGGAAGLTSTPARCRACRQRVRYRPGGSSCPDCYRGIVGAWRDRCGRGPRPDPAVAAQHAARYLRVCGRVLQAPHRIGADADHVVAVPDGIPGGLDPNGGGVIRTVRMPGQPIAAGTPFGAMTLLCARLIFPAVAGVCPLAGQGEGSSAIAGRDSISAGGLAGSLPNE